MLYKNPRHIVVSINLMIPKVVKISQMKNKLDQNKLIISVEVILFNRQFQNITILFQYGL